MGKHQAPATSAPATPAKKTIIDFNKPVLGYDGEPEVGDPLNKILGPIIGSNTTGDAYKFGSWAMEVYQGKVLELDTSDFKALKDFLTEAKFHAIIKMQALQILDGIR